MHLNSKQIKFDYHNNMGYINFMTSLSLYGQFATRLKEYRDELLNYFEEKYHFSCISLDKVKDLSETKGKVVISTLHGVKGLEFKNLIVFNFSKNTFPMKFLGFNKMSEEEKELYIKSEFSLLYVAFSRAICNLLITGVGTKVNFVQDYIKI